MIRGVGSCCDSNRVPSLDVALKPPARFDFAPQTFMVVEHASVKAIDQGNWM